MKSIARNKKMEEEERRKRKRKARRNIRRGHPIDFQWPQKINKLTF